MNGYVGNAVACEQAKRQPMVEPAIGQVADRTNYTSELVAQLAQRLATVLRPAPPQPTGSGVKVEAAPSCELEARLRCIAANGALNNEALLDILDRLEV